MGVLLMQYEYQMAKADKTLYERKAMLLNNQKKRLTTRIGNIDKLFAKRDSAIESKWNKASSEISMALSTGRVDQAALGIAVGTIGSILGASAIAGFDVSTELANMDGNESTKLAALANQLQTYVNQIIEAMKTAEKEELEYTKEAQLAPLHEKDAELDINIATNETLSTMADAREEKARTRLQEVAKNSTAGYGLG